MTQFDLHALAAQLHIPEIGVAPWPLPIEASHHLDTPYPCPVTAGPLDER